jgi:deoxyribodipyrimidine photo-lyase
MIDNRRIRILKQGNARHGPVILWMSRDQRIDDNWALLFAQELAIKQKAALGVIFCLVPRFLGATIRQYDFMIRGLQEVEKCLRERNIPFFLLAGVPEMEIPKFVKRHKIGSLVADFNPLRINAKWKKSVMKHIDIPVHEVDAHNIVPCWTAALKQEYSARTLRPKLSRLLPEFLTDFPSLKKHPYNWEATVSNADWWKSIKTLDVDLKVHEVDWIKPGQSAASRAMQNFLKGKLSHYDKVRNDPLVDGQSNLSPYLHFGQISPQRIALNTLKISTVKKSRDAFLEELIVRRELSDNFCFYNGNYDNIEGFPSWAKKTLDEHRYDKKEYVYTLEQFENAVTHDPLWNAAQMEMTKKGKMHGYMRMYWAKKILEWSESPEEAVKIAIHLNDRYELDGRDPNGYAGIAWSIGGVHDRAWNERPIFGKIRYMSYNGCKAKFDVQKYIEAVKSL